MAEKKYVDFEALQALKTNLFSKFALQEVVTTTDNGLMTPAHKAKLDGIDENATNTTITLRTWTMADI